LASKTEPHKARLDVNNVIRDVVPLVRTAVLSHRVSLRVDLASALPPVLGDRVQLQQVLINLVMNGIEAMASVENRPPELVIRSRPHGGDEVLVDAMASMPFITDRKSTRLNSSHLVISYAIFCLKKKNN